MAPSETDAPQRPVGLEHLSLYAEPLADFVDAASAAGAASVCLSVNHPEVLDPRSRADALARIADLGLSVSMGDGFLIGPLAAPGADGLKRQLDLLVELGGPLANACAFEPDAHAPRDPASVQDQLGELCVLAASAGVGVLIEFTPLSHVPSLRAAVELAGQLVQPNLSIMLDTLHLARAGEGPADLAGIDASLIGYCQLSDGPRTSPGLAEYLDEAVNDRLVPGDGELPLAQLLALLPAATTISAEVPLRAMRDAGTSAAERARLALDGTRRVVAAAHGLAGPGTTR